MGKVMMSGIVPQLTAPVNGLPASELAVGSTVKLMENGVAVDYLVVNQGKPSGSNLYDDSCDGVWLLRKDIYAKRQWHNSKDNDYENSTIHSYLNSTFLSLFDESTQGAIKQVKLPYRNGSGYGTTISSGASGLPTKIFLLSGTEVSLNRSDLTTNEGAELFYFLGCADYNESDNKRIAYLNGSAAYWWLRSPNTQNNTYGKLVAYLGSNGGCGTDYSTSSYGIRPALILPHTAKFDPETLILKGV